MAPPRSDAASRSYGGGSDAASASYGGGSDALVFQFLRNPKTATDGRSVNILLEDGTLPMTYRGVTYHTPIVIYLMEMYPLRAPYVYVYPTRAMISNGLRHPSGFISTPYLQNWNPSSNLVELVCNLGSYFSSQDPPFSTRANPNPNPNASGLIYTPYLQNWNPSSNLVELVCNLGSYFSSQDPPFSTRANPNPNPNFSYSLFPQRVPREILNPNPNPNPDFSYYSQDPPFSQRATRVNPNPDPPNPNPDFSYYSQDPPFSQRATRVNPNPDPPNPNFSAGGGSQVSLHPVMINSGARPVIPPSTNQPREAGLLERRREEKVQTEFGIDLSDDDLILYQPRVPRVEAMEDELKQVMEEARLEMEQVMEGARLETEDYINQCMGDYKGRSTPRYIVDLSDDDDIVYEPRAMNKPLLIEEPSNVEELQNVDPGKKGKQLKIVATDEEVEKEFADSEEEEEVDFTDSEEEEEVDFTDSDSEEEKRKMMIRQTRRLKQIEFNNNTLKMPGYQHEPRRKNRDYN